MSSEVRAEISKNNIYWVSKHRYYELKHFCLQYKLWKDMYESFDGFDRVDCGAIKSSKTNSINDPTSKAAESRLYYKERIDLVVNTAKETDDLLWSYILTGVTEGKSYNYLRMNTNLPCCRDSYYDLYRKFFYILDKRRG